MRNSSNVVVGVREDLEAPLDGIVLLFVLGVAGDLLNVEQGEEDECRYAACVKLLQSSSESEAGKEERCGRSCHRQAETQGQEAVFVDKLLIWSA